MKQLDEKFKSDGFSFEQLKRDGDIALFRKRKPIWHEDSYSYEVVIIQKQKEREAFGHKFEAKEKMPSSEQWGKAGWTCIGLERAKEKFNELAGNAHKS